MCKSIATICNHVIFLWVCNTGCSGRTDIEGILPKGPYLSCVSMAGRAHFGRIPSTYCHKWRRERGNIKGDTLHWLEVQCQSEQTGRTIIEGILPKGPYLPCVSMEVRALLVGYPRIVFQIIQTVHLGCVVMVGDACTGAHSTAKLRLLLNHKRKLVSEKDPNIQSLRWTTVSCLYWSFHVNPHLVVPLPCDGLCNWRNLFILTFACNWVVISDNPTFHGRA